MADLPSRLDLQNIGRDYVVTRAKKLNPAQVDIAGSDVNIIVGSASSMAFQLVLQLAFAVNRLLLDGANDEDLDRYAFDRYQLPRKGASPAVGTVRFYRAVATLGAGSIPAGTRLQTLTGIEYLTTTTATFGAADLTVTADVSAVQAGKLTQVGANQIRKFANPGDSFDPSMKINNDDPTAGGEDAEDDDTFRNRIRDFWRTARRGILAAIEFGAISVPGVVSAQAVEALTPDPRPARVVNLYIADSSGVASEALASTVRNALDEYRAGGIAVIISTSLPQIVSIKLALTFGASTDTSSLTTQVLAAVVEFVNSLPVNGTLYRAQLFAVMQRFADSGLLVGESSIVAPAGDLVPTLGRTLRTTITDVIAA